MFGFWKSRKAEVLDHWIAFVEGFDLSSTEFYESVEKEIKARELPGLQMSRVEFAEGGILSGKRTYLRLVRERLVFDVCAAPFGRSFFFSCRFAEIPAVVHLWHLAVLVVLLGFCGIGSLNVLVRLLGVSGLMLWPVAWVLFFLLAIYVMRNSSEMGFPDMDRTLVQTPVIGPVYEAWIRKETYYRQDSRLLYLKIVSETVKHLAEEATTAKGVKLTEQYEQAPILGEIYKRRTPQTDPEEQIA